MKNWLAALFIALTASIPVAAQAQEFPSSPMRFILQTAPGGSGEFLARIVADEFTKLTRQPVVIEPRPGAGGTIAAAATLANKPDGYTLLLAIPSTHVISSLMFKDITYNPETDFKPVSTLMRAPYYLYINPKLPVKNVAELVDYAKKNPGKLTFASSGNMDPTHTAIVQFNLLAGVNIVHVPYKGVGAGLQDLLAGRVDGMFGTGPGGMPHVEAGTLKVLAVTYPNREPERPDLPAVAETVSGFELTTWGAMFASARVPNDRIAILNNILVRILSEPGVIERLKKGSLDARAGTPDELAKLLAQEKEKTVRIIKEGNITLN